MGDPSRYPEIRMARFLYAMKWLPPDLRADYQLRQLCNNGSTTTCQSYLDALALAFLQDRDHSYRSNNTWPEYHNKHMCRLGVCPNYLWTIDVYVAFQTPPEYRSDARFIRRARVDS